MYLVSDFGCTPFKVPLSHLICQAAAYLSIKDHIQSMVLSSLGNISGWSSILTCSDIHHASKSSPGFPYNHLGDRILSGLAGAGRGEAGGAGIAAAGGGEAGGAGIAAAGGGAAGAGGGAAGGNGNAGDPPPPGDPPASEQVGAGGRETSR